MLTKEEIVVNPFRIIYLKNLHSSRFFYEILPFTLSIFSQRNFNLAWMRIISRSTVCNFRCTGNVSYIFKHQFFLIKKKLELKK